MSDMSVGRQAADDVACKPGPTIGARPGAGTVTTSEHDARCVNDGVVSCPNGIKDPDAAAQICGGSVKAILSLGYRTKPRDPASRTADEWLDKAKPQAARRARAPRLKPGASPSDSSSMGYDVKRRPGQWVTEQADRRGRRLALYFLLYFAVTGLFLAFVWGHRVGVVAIALFVGAALLVKPRLERRIDQHARWVRGARAECAVGEILEELKYEGWIVMHDVTPDRRGNVDHIVSGPNGVYLIETKQRRYIPEHLGKVKRQAARLHDSLEVYVTPVICLHERSGGAFKTKGVSVVPSTVLLAWLHAQRNRPVEFERLARFADSV